MANQIVWCDISVRDLERAISFYSAVLGHDVKRHDLSGVTLGILPHNDGEVGGLPIDELRRTTRQRRSHDLFER